MAGRRLLDLASLFNASRGVAQKHVALRARQLDVYNRTSTISRAVRSQTERVTETAKAASILASRLNESAPAWTYDIKEDNVTASGQREEQPIPSKESVEGSPSHEVKEGIEQDHHYEQSPANTPTDSPPEQDLDVHQEKPDRYPLPDGTIPPDDFSEAGRSIDTDTPSIRPRDEPSKEPLEHDGLHPKSSGSSTIPVPSQTTLSSKSARVAQRDAEFHIPSRTADALDNSVKSSEGHDEDSFSKLSTHTSTTLSSLPRAKIPKHSSDVQEPENPGKATLNPDTFYGGAKSEPVAVDEEIPEGVNLDLFHNPRIARKLGGRVQKGGIGLESSNSAKKPQFASFGHPQNLVKDVQGKQEAARSETSVGNLKDLANDISQDVAVNNKMETPTQAAPYELRESKVPSSRIGRLWNYGGLAAGMFGGAITESLRRVGGGGGEGSYMLSAGNMERLVAKLSRMRGAALKLGQMISFQDSKMLPAPIQEVLQRVQDRADYMPASQRNKVMTANLGSDWRDLFSSFDEKPIAAASIGQVHSAVLKSNGTRVAVKVQYPGVAGSIDSDLNNLAVLLTASRLLPKGLFLDKTIANARTELAWECDYIREAACGRRFQELLADETDTFVVPKVFPEASGQQVLTMEFLDGIGVTRVKSFTQEQRDWIGTQILRLCLREITEFKYMQTDPNWTNFLYNAETNKLELLDFGASREYPEEFITRYTKLLAAASIADKKVIRDLSIELGYLTGQESKAMLDAHIASILTLAEPFIDSSPEVYDFKDQTITERVKALIPVMIRERLSPPPEETYSLHRKLSGAFLLCARLGSRVRCRELFQNSMKKAGLVQ
ncbi:Protein kinase-like (PK-like) [Glarea lozoyensis ATCC 20868]|uniref:Protein kinase-like (PK-like) n=1 Tax=Glarea lozoyensis (strain ATCC 20868 / MF5171) TaxID=1116229 RepID=S3D3B2_GLAL2|nr:Protein kinase-like (PK-like) [Glarea lozoyensis ATCC 20868]EPE31649.1 Protein kinase-like (PK-like) [Glarea lozoyensis ATCC 20868]